MPKAAVMANFPIMVRVMMTGTSDVPFTVFSGIKMFTNRTIPATTWNEQRGHRLPNLKETSYDLNHGRPTLKYRA